MFAIMLSRSICACTGNACVGPAFASLYQTTCTCAALAPAACSQGASSPAATSSGLRPTGAYYTQILNQVKQQVTTDFERQVLTDDVITRAEYEEIFSKFSSCMKTAGFPIQLTADSYGRYSYSTPATPGASEADARCSQGTINPLAALYNDFVINAGGDDPAILLLACLKRHGVVPADFSLESLKRDMSDPSNAKVASPANPEVAKCVTDPKG